MKLTRAIFLALAFLIPAVGTVAKAEDKPAPAAGEAAPAPEGKKAKKSKKSKKDDKKTEETPADKK